MLLSPSGTNQLLSDGVFKNQLQAAASRKELMFDADCCCWADDFTDTSSAFTATSTDTVASSSTVDTARASSTQVPVTVRRICLVLIQTLSLMLTMRYYQLN